MGSSRGHRAGYAPRRAGSQIAGAVEARERAIAWAQAVTADPDVVFLDTETTGLDETAEVVDIAVVGGDGAILLDSLVRPVRSIPMIASGIHGIRDADVVGAPTWAELYPQLEEAIGGRHVVVYNASFDSRLVTQCCAACAMAVPELAWKCAMLAFAEFCAEPGRSGGFKWHRLDLAAARFGIKPGGHRALADALVCRSVVLNMARAAMEGQATTG